VTVDDSRPEDPRPNLHIDEAPLAADNKGYGLLKKAGWREGTGLGAKRQGAATFLAPASQQHSRGLGFIKKAKH
jgi:hypothetical protein